MASISKEKNTVITGIWTGHWNKNKLPLTLYKKTGNHFITALKTGYKKEKRLVNLAPELDIKFGTVDHALMNDLTRNVWMFSAAKTYQQVRGMEATKKALEKASAALVDEKGEKITKYKAFRDGYYLPDGTFVEGASQIFDEFNENWLATEYDTIIAMAQTASHWVNIEENKDVLPYLKFVAVEDEVTCPICSELDGVCLPVDDSFWDENYPVSHFNCRCDVIQLDEGEGEKDESTKAEAQEASDRADANGRTDLFKMNSGKDGIIFKTDGEGKHPYFDVAKGDNKFMKNNFGLPLSKGDTAKIATGIKKTK